MKTPNADDFENYEDLIKKFNYNINILCRNKKGFLNYLNDEESVIKIKLDNYSNNFNFFYSLQVLISDKDYEETINFIFEFKLIKAAYKILIKKSNEEKIIQIIGVKIISDLINNYKAFTDETTINTYKKKLEKMKKNIHVMYENVLENKKYVGLVEKFHLPKELEELNVEDIYSKIVLNLFEDTKLDDIKNIDDYSNKYEIDSNFIDKNTIEKVKEKINSRKDQSQFKLTGYDFSCLIYNIDSKKSNLSKKIEFLYILMAKILNDPSDLKNFSFLSDTKQILDEVFYIYDKYNLLGKMDKGTKIRFEKILDIFDKNKDIFPNIGDTSINSSIIYGLKVRRVYIKNYIPIKTEKKERVMIQPKIISKELNIVMSKQEFVYSTSSLILYENIYISPLDEKTFFEQPDNNTNNTQYLLNIYEHGILKKKCFEDYDYSPTKEINRIENIEIKNQYYGYIKNLLNNIKQIEEEYIHNIDYKVIIKEVENVVIMVLRCENKTHSFTLEKEENIMREINNFPQLLC